jgi:DNA-directed RNA polymerase I subunit RPA1
VAFDPNHTPLPGGLYDPRLGPTSARDGSCTTCARSGEQCPGHFGHIELAVPVYHPLLFPEVLAFLRAKCLACHALKLASPQLLTCAAKFVLLQQNRIAELLDLDRVLGTRMSVARENELDAAKGRAAAQHAMEQHVRDILQSATTSTSSNRTSTRHEKTSYHRMCRKRLVQEWVGQLKSCKKCNGCGAMSPRIRHDSHNKIFRAELSKQNERINKAENISFISALEEEAEATKDDEERKRNYDSDDTERPEEDLMDSEGVEKDANDDEDSEEYADEKVVAARDKYMHPGEVQAQLKRTWELEPFLCNCLFGSGTDYFSTTGYQVYFLQAVPVPPSRFRPPMFLNGMAVEHSQTQYLGKVIQLNEMIRNNFASGTGESRAYTAWIDLQTTVNCFMDSAKDPSAVPVNQVAPGIKQILERKEGLFRKNMMGKRVDYACRSVISPDPYIGTNEIGLPHYFASVLTFPTPVIDLNVKEMRQLVERGPDQYPAARWVEFNGKRVDLSKMSRHQRQAVAAQLLTHMKKGGMPAIVGRQLRDGDYVLMNRQVRWCSGWRWQLLR